MAILFMTSYRKFNLSSFFLDLLRDAVKNGDYITVKVALNSNEEYNLDQEVVNTFVKSHERGMENSSLKITQFYFTFCKSSARSLNKTQTSYDVETTAPCLQPPEWAVPLSSRRLLCPLPLRAGRA